jgi:hypothetical protein
MLETPDFDAIARAIVTTILEKAGQDLIQPDTRSQGRAEADVAEQFRLVWNARGAADIVKIEAELTSRTGDTASESYVKHLDRALRSLDR